MPKLYIGRNEVTPAILANGGDEPIKRFQLLDRVEDDNGDEIGTVSGFFKDANNVEYAVVCIDRLHYGKDLKFCNDTSNVITGLPEFNTNLGLDRTPFLDKNTATFNTQKIADFCTSTGAVSTAVNHCRNLSYVVDGVTYYGQLPNCMELIDIVSHCDVINITNPSRGFYYPIWSSTQKNASDAWYIGSYGYLHNTSKSQNCLVIPVLEILNQ